MSTNSNPSDTSSNSSLNTKELYNNAKVVGIEELPELAGKLPDFTIVCVKDKFSQPYILVTNAKDNKTWIEWHGESIAEIQVVLDLQKEGYAKYAEKARDASEMNELRLALQAVATLKFICKDWDDSLIESILQSVIMSIAVKWYRADHPDDKRTDSQIADEDDKELALVLVVVDYYVKRLIELITNIKAHGEQTNENS